MRLSAQALVSSGETGAVHFADEVVAKLMTDLGEENFRERVTIANINETVRQLINKAVSQRVKLNAEIVPTEA